jgi:hypothetical protein
MFIFDSSVCSREKGIFLCELPSEADVTVTRTEIYGFLASKCL